MGLTCSKPLQIPPDSPLAAITDRQLEEFREAFKTFDKDGGGSIDAGELVWRPSPLLWQIASLHTSLLSRSGFTVGLVVMLACFERPDRFAFLSSPSSLTLWVERRNGLAMAPCNPYNAADGVDPRRDGKDSAPLR